jgi:hypothetical protein
MPGPTTAAGTPRPNSARNLSALRMTRGGAAAVALGAAAGVGGTLLMALVGGNKIPDPFTGMEPLSFPNDLKQLGHWVEFTAYETKGLGTDLLQKANFGTKINGGTIKLPMPANLSTDYNPEYTNGTLGAGASGEALKAGDRAIYGNNDVPALAAAGGAMAAAAAGGAAGAASGIAKAFGIEVPPAVSGAVGATQDTGAAALKVLAGLAQNPHKVVLFTGVNFREHQFSWRLSPRNRNESNAIKLITDMFAYYAHPEYVAGALFFKYPEFFRIKFRHPDYLFQLQPSVLKDIRVNYHAQGYPGYVRDRDGGGPPAPAEVELSLTFQETEIITKQTLYEQLSVNLPIERRLPVSGVFPSTQPPNTGR